MTSISKFDANVYSEELHQFSEADYDEVMSLMAEPDFEGYREGDVENFYVEGGRVYHKPEPKSLARLVVVI